MPPLPSSPKRNPKMHICDCYGFTVCGVVRGVHACVLIYIYVCTVYVCMNVLTCTCMYVHMYVCTLEHGMHVHVCTVCTHVMYFH